MRALVCDPIHDVGLERLRSAGIEVVDGTDLADDELEAALAGTDALVVRSATTVDAGLIESAPDLEVVARAGIGIDNIDLAAADAAGVAVVNAPAGGVGAVTEHTVALAYALVRALPWTDRATRAGRWPKASYGGAELRELTVGIVGLGRIGRAVAARTDAIGADLVGTDPYVRSEQLAPVDLDLLDLDRCLDRADLATVHTPLTEETRGLIDAASLERLEGGYLVTCARGGVVDEDALVAALDGGTLAGAAVDVYEDEPLSADHPLTACDRALLTPHVAGSSDRARRTIATEVADQLIAARDGDALSNLVNDPG